MDFRGFYSWEKIISHNYDMLFSRPTPEQENRVVMPAKDKIPDELNWVSIMDKLSNNDITKHKDIYEINYQECLTLMSLWHHRDRYLQQLQRGIDRNNK